MTAIQGATLIEVIIAGAIGAVVLVAGAKFYSKMQPALRMAYTRQVTQTEARNCLDTIVERLRAGKAGQYEISTPLEYAVKVPNSKIEFNLHKPLTVGATTFYSYVIYLASGSVYAGEKSSKIVRTRALASDVSALMFSAVATDPGVISVSLRIDKPWDVSNDTSHVTSIFYPNQVVRMVEVQ